jgi:putative oxidoreductase
MLVLRISLTLLMLIWRVDKLVNVEHGMLVSERFYLGAFRAGAAAGVRGSADGARALIVLGLFGKYLYCPFFLSSPA